MEKYIKVDIVMEELKSLLKSSKIDMLRTNLENIETTLLARSNNNLLTEVICLYRNLKIKAKSYEDQSNRKDYGNAHIARERYVGALHAVKWVRNLIIEYKPDFKE